MPNLENVKLVDIIETHKKEKKEKLAVATTFAGIMAQERETDKTPDLVEGIFLLMRNSCFDTCQLQNSAKQKEHKIVVYDKRSIYLFKDTMTIRKAIVRIMHSNLFENSIVFIIFMNSLTLAMTDYGDRDNKTDYNQSLEQISQIFSYIFILEFVLKVIAMGFVIHRNSYLRDPWNSLDFIVVLSGLIEIFSGDSGGKTLRSLRVLRVLRPLKSINAFPKMRRIISALLSSITTLGNAVLFMMFIFLLFGIFGVQQFGSTMYQKCRYSDKPNLDGTWPYDKSISHLCSKDSTGNYECPSDRYCHSPNDAGLPVDIDDVLNDEQIDYGITVFDNLGIGFLTVFQMITLEGWAKIMYNMMDSNTAWLASVFSILLIMIGAFFLLNVILAVLAEALHKVDAIEKRHQAKLDRDVYMSLKRRELQDKARMQADPNATRSEVLVDFEPVLLKQNKTDIQPTKDKDQAQPDDIQTQRRLLSKDKSKDQVVQGNSGKKIASLINSESVSMIQPPQSSESKIPNVEILRSQESSPEVDDVLSAKSSKYNNVGNLQPVKEESETNQTAQVQTFTEVTRVMDNEGRTSHQAIMQLDHINEENQSQESNIQHSQKDNTLGQKPKKEESSLFEEHEGSSYNFSGSQKQQESKNEEKEFILPDFDENYIARSEPSEQLNYQRAITASMHKSSIIYDTIPERAQTNCLYKVCYILCTHWSFTFVITVLIILNTAALALESYPPNEERTRIAELLNQTFSWCFLVEMIIKLLGLGFKDYSKDSFNLFDASLVIISFVEDMLSNVGYLSDDMSSGGALSAFRSIRLLRIFKLARSWLSFRILLVQIYFTFKEVAYFLVLLVICMFIFSLLGMELYAKNVQFTLDGQVINDLNSNEPRIEPRPNFDTFGMAITSIFIVFIGEDWYVLMHSHYRAKGNSALFFFPFLLICQHLILLNLFLAMLLQNFEVGRIMMEKQIEEQQQKEDKKVKNLRQRIKFFVSCKCCRKQQWGQSGDNYSISSHPLVREKDNTDSLHLESINEREDDEDKAAFQSERSSECNDDKDPKDNKQQTQQFSNNNSIVNSSPEGVNIPESKNEEKKQSTDQNQNENTVHQDVEKDKNDIQLDKKSAKKKKNSRTADVSKEKPEDQKYSETMRKKAQMLLNPTHVNMSISALKKLDFLDKEGNIIRKVYNLQGKSCMIFTPDSNIRKVCKRIVEHPYYNSIVLFLISISTVLLTLDNPLNDPNGILTAVLNILDIVLTILFTLECTINIILVGFLMNGKESYLNDSWNVLDFLIVVFSLLNLAASGVDLGIIKLFRMLRVLRPLRVLKRNLGMKIQVISLLNSIPGVINLLAITMLLLMLFGIQAVNFFAGKMYYCNMENIPGDFHDEITSQWDCYDFGGEWLRMTDNFENVGHAMITMFYMLTTDSWPSLMWKLVDATNIHQVSIRNYNPPQIIFCIVFVIFGALFILNLFVGVVISTFNREKEKLSNNKLLTNLQYEYLEVLLNVYMARPQNTFTPSGNKMRDVCRKIAMTEAFGNVILACIIFNTICLAITWLGEPPELTQVMEIINIVFTVVYTFEMMIKLIAEKSKYFKDGWNRFDFLIVIFAWLGMISSYFGGLQVGGLTTIIRSFRILRVLKLIRKAKSLQKIFNTFLLAIPELMNTGALLFLFLFLFAVLGVFLFSEVRLQDNLNAQANFQNFGSAILTLFRMTTGEGWEQIMYDCARQRSITFKCQQQTYEERQRDGINGCGSPWFAFSYFVCFILVVSLIFLNLFIAIILEGQLKASQKQDARVSDETRNAFIKAWMKYDRDATGFISVNDLPKMIFDLAHIEFLERKQQIIKKKQVMFNLTRDRSVKVLMKIKKDLPLNEIEKMVKEEYNLKEEAELEFNKFIGQLAIPLYNELKNYNFHDTLVSFVKWLFSEQHRRDYEGRAERIKYAWTNQTTDKLSFWDRIKQESKEYWNLELMDQERVLEADNPDFQKVIDRLEDKGRDGVLILRLNNVRRLRVKTGKKIQHKMDLNKRGNAVLDSAFLINSRAEDFRMEQVSRRDSRPVFSFESQPPKAQFTMKIQMDEKQQEIYPQKNSTQALHSMPYQNQLPSFLPPIFDPNASQKMFIINDGDGRMPQFQLNQQSPTPMIDNPGRMVLPRSQMSLPEVNFSQEIESSSSCTGGEKPDSSGPKMAHGAEDPDSSIMNQNMNLPQTEEQKIQGAANRKNSRALSQFYYQQQSQDSLE